MLTFSLQSGSNGNAIYVEAGDQKLLFDAGISGKLATQRMAEHGRDMRGVDALFISHDHSDHVCCAGIYQRMFHVPIYITQRTLDAAKRRTDLGRLHDVRPFRAGDSLTFDGVIVHTIRTAHDAVEGVAFVVEREGKRLGILTDLGHRFPGLEDVLNSVDGAYLESNYDPTMLDEGPYPYYLKARIRGVGGHLSNRDAAELLRACGRSRPAWIAVAHLSEHNNTPELAVNAQHDAVGRDYPVYHASRDGVSAVLEL